MRECPACAAAAETKSQPSPAVEESGMEAGIASLAQTFKITAPAPLVAAPVNGKSGHVPGTATLTSVEVAPREEEALAIPPGEAMESLVRPLVESVELAPSQLAEEVAARAAAEEARRRAEAEEQARREAEEAKRAAELEAEQARLAAEEFARRTQAEAKRLAQALSEAVKLQAKAALETARTRFEAEEQRKRAEAEAALTAQAFAEAARIQAEAELEASRARREAEEKAKRDELEAALTAEALSAASEIQAGDVLAEIGAQLEAEQALARAQAENSAAVQALCGALELHAETVLLPICEALDAEQAAIDSLVTSFQRQSAAGLLSAPSEILVEPGPPTVEWMRMARPSIPARAPADPSSAAFVSPPQPSTLAGPCLPSQFRNLSGLLVTGESRSRRPISVPAWSISVLVAITLFLATGALVRHYSEGRTASTSEAAAPTVQPTSSAPIRSSQSSALAKALEVSGLRVVNAGWNRKPQVEFLLINHSATDLSGMNIQVAVKSAEAFGSNTPILNINAFVRSLGAYQSKEIRTELDSDIPASTFSDWQSLRTEVQVSNAQ